MMGWVRLDDGFFEHPKIVALSNPQAALLYLASLTYCARNLTDGFIHRNALTLIAARAGVPAKCANRLVEVGLWDVIEDGIHDNWMIHDYLDWQTSRADIDTQRSKARDRMKKVRENGHRSSPDVRPNNDRTTTEVPPKFRESSLNQKVEGRTTGSSSSSLSTRGAKRLEEEEE